MKKIKNDIKEYSYYVNDYDINSIYTEVVKPDPLISIKAENKKLATEIAGLRDLISELVNNNIEAAKLLIRKDPFHIAYVKIQVPELEVLAVTLDPRVYLILENPSQEATDTYRLVK